MSGPVARPARFGFWGNFGTANWGNECTLHAALTYARSHVPGVEVVCLCSEPSDTTARHGLPAFPISRARGAGGAPAPYASAAQRVVRRLAREVREWSNALEVARGFDVLIMAGTGMLTDVDEGPFGLPYDMFRWALAARVSGGRVRFASVGVEPIEHPLARLFIGAALRLADYRSYRDRESRDHLVRLGLAPSKDAVCPDLAFSLPETVVTARLTVSRRPRTVGVGLYDYKGRGQRGAEDAAEYRGYLAKVCAFTRWLLDAGYEVRVVLGDLTYDEPVLRDFRAALGEDAGRVHDEPARSLDELLDQLSGVDFVVASRFHTVLLSLLLGKPVISISYNPKNDVLMREADLGEYCQSIDRLDVALLVAQFGRLERLEGALRTALAARIASYREALKRQYDLLFW